MRRTPSRSTIAASPIATRASTTAPSPTSTQAIKLNPDYAVAHLQPRHRLLRQARLRPRHCRASTRRSSSIRTTSLALHDRGVARYDKHDYERAIADFEQLVKSGVSTGGAQPEGPHARTASCSYDRWRRERAAPDQAQPELRAGVQRSRPRVQLQGRVRPRHRRLQPVDQDQSERAAPPTTTAATPSTASAISTRRWRTSTPRSSSIRRSRWPTTIAA